MSGTSAILQARDLGGEGSGEIVTPTRESDEMSYWTGVQASGVADGDVVTGKATMMMQTAPSMQLDGIAG